MVAKKKGNKHAAAEKRKSRPSSKRASQEIEKQTADVSPEKPPERPVVEVTPADDWFEGEEWWSEHPCHPLKYCCESCQAIIRELERAAFAFGFQSVFTFFEEAQLLRMEEYITGEERMLPKPGQTQSNRGGRQQNQLPFLKVENLTTTPQAAQILAARYEPEAKFGNTVQVKVAINGRHFKWGINPDKNPNYGLMVERLGEDETKWKGQTILLGAEENDDEFNPMLFIRVTFPAKRAAAQ